jgi:two-component system sensor histidine kinase BaeS
VPLGGGPRGAPHRPGPPWSGGWATGEGHRWRGPPRHRRHWGLRRRLTFTYAFVALAAVALTSWLTLGAVFRAQGELFGAEWMHGGPPWERLVAPDEGRDGAAAPGLDGEDVPDLREAREAFRGVARTGLLAALLAFLVATWVAGAVTRRLTRPLLALEGGARRLAAGERGMRLALPPSRDELRNLTEAFNSLVSGLERQESWRRGVVADIAHDLRTPLSVLRSEIEAMQDGVRPLDEEGLARLHQEVMRLTRLVEDLRTLSVAEAGGLGLEREPIDVVAFLGRVADGFASRAGSAGVELRLGRVAEGLEVEADPAALARVLDNLVDNALRYAAPGAVELGARSAGGEVLITVRDHGPGLPEGEADRLFERFYRGDPSRARQEGTGSGLGLSIAKALVEAHGGRLEARDHPEGGAEFTVVLPAPA